MHGSRIFLSGGGGGGGGPGSSTYFTEGVQWSYYTFSRGGGGVQLFPGGFQLLISIETHITITCDFPGGSGTHIPLWIRTFWHE